VAFITAETGGDAVVAERLAERGAADLGISVHSDGSHALLLPTSETNYKIEPMIATGYNEKANYNEGHHLSYTDYEMVQPALVVLDANGAATQKWSWKLMGLEDEKYATGQYGSAMTMVPNPDGEGEVPLVMLRPLTSDIGPSIAEGRQCKMQKIAM